MCGEDGGLTLSRLHGLATEYLWKCRSPPTSGWAKPRRSRKQFLRTFTPKAYSRCQTPECSNPKMTKVSGKSISETSRLRQSVIRISKTLLLAPMWRRYPILAPNPSTTPKPQTLDQSLSQKVCEKLCRRCSNAASACSIAISAPAGAAEGRCIFINLTIFYICTQTYATCLYRCLCVSI